MHRRIPYGLLTICLGLAAFPAPGLVADEPAAQLVAGLPAPTPVADSPATKPPLSEAAFFGLLNATGSPALTVSAATTTEAAAAQLIIVVLDLEVPAGGGLLADDTGLGDNVFEIGDPPAGNAAPAATLAEINSAWEKLNQTLYSDTATKEQKIKALQDLAALREQAKLLARNERGDQAAQRVVDGMTRQIDSTKEELGITTLTPTPPTPSTPPAPTFRPGMPVPSYPSGTPRATAAAAVEKAQQDLKTIHSQQPPANAPLQTRVNWQARRDAAIRALSMAQVRLALTVAGRPTFRHWTDLLAEIDKIIAFFTELRKTNAKADEALAFYNKLREAFYQRKYGVTQGSTPVDMGPIYQWALAKEQEVRALWGISAEHGRQLIALLRGFDRALAKVFLERVQSGVALINRQMSAEDKRNGNTPRRPFRVYFPGSGGERGNLEAELYPWFLQDLNLKLPSGFKFGNTDWFDHRGFPSFDDDARKILLEQPNDARRAESIPYSSTEGMLAINLDENPEFLVTSVADLEAIETSTLAGSPVLFATATSTGTSSGAGAFDISFVNLGKVPVRLSGQGVILEPIGEEQYAALMERMNALAASFPVFSAAPPGYCVQKDERPPGAGELYVLASAGKQQEYSEVRRILGASQRLYDTGQLHPDSNPEQYFHSTRQWAIWTHEKGYDREKFVEAFVEHTKNNLALVGQPWNEQIEERVRSLLPNRRQDIEMILAATRQVAEEA